MKFETGNIEAFEKLFLELYPRLCAVANHYLNDEEQSKDMVQEAFVNLWNAGNVSSTILSVKSYLYTAVRNLCLNYLRDYKKNVSFSIEQVEVLDESFKAVVIEEETIAQLYASIENLSPQSSRIMKYVLQGKGNQEIAEAMGISVNTVKTLKYNAMRTLKNDLKEMYGVFLAIFGIM